jgi:hypothetical protein
MPKNSNKGFALVPVLVGALFLGLAGLAVYHYYPQNNNNLNLNQAENSEDVLAGTSTNVDLNTFMFKNLLESNSVADFNKKSDALILCLAGLPYQMGDYEDGFPTDPTFSQCAFFPRGASAQNITYKSGGKTMSAKAYTGVTFQALARKDRWSKYIVFVPNSGSTITLKSQYKPYNNDAGVVIIKQTEECKGNIPAASPACNLSNYVNQDTVQTSKIVLNIENDSYGTITFSVLASDTNNLKAALKSWGSGLTAIVAGKSTILRASVPTVPEGYTTATFSVFPPANTTKITFPKADYQITNKTAKPYHYNIVGNDMILAN